MAFGEYLSDLHDQNIWNATGIHLDREHCLARLEEVRDVRDGAMHFNASSNEGNSDAHNDEEVITAALRILGSIPFG